MKKLLYVAVLVAGLVGCGGGGTSSVVEKDTLAEVVAAGDAVVAGDVVDDVAADSVACEPLCDGKECGPDGCGGDCGTCPLAAPLCSDQGLCEVECVPDCEDRECGEDGCGGDCGTCPEIAPVCGALGKCEMECDPDCDGKDCGDDGCGGNCGECSDDLVCESGVCIELLCDGVDCSGHGDCVVNGADASCDCDPGYFAEGLECIAADWVFSCTFTVYSNLDSVGGNPSTDLFDPLEGVETDIDIYWNLVSLTEDLCDYSMDPEPCTEVSCEIVSVVMDGAVGALATYAEAFKGSSFKFSLINEGGSDVYRFGPNITSEGSENFYGFELMASDVDVMINGEYPVLENFIGNHDVILRRYLTPSSMSDFASAEATCTATEL